MHATNHARNLGLIKETEENLQSAIDGENFEVEEMYPAYDAIAKLQGEKGAQQSIYYAVEAEKIHAKLYEKAKEAVRSGNDVDIDSVYICPVCGYTAVGEAPGRCPVCGARGEDFKEF